jgi:hypothetical protein
MLKRRKCLALWQQAFGHLAANEPDVLEWARDTGEHTFKTLRAKAFLRNYCFVVYASGFRYRTIKDCFPGLTQAFHSFDLERLSRMGSLKPVLRVFGNERKARNFRDGAKMIANEGFVPFKRRLAKEGAEALLGLPGIGRITKDHLAKNIGLSDVAKADVWLVRAAEYCGTPSVDEMIDFLHDHSGESRHVIDVALWTYGRDTGLRGRTRKKQSRPMEP